MVGAVKEAMEEYHSPERLINWGLKINPAYQ